MRLMILLLVGLLGKGVLAYFGADETVRQPELTTMEHGSGTPPFCCEHAATSNPQQ